MAETITCICCKTEAKTDSVFHGWTTYRCPGCGNVWEVKDPNYKPPSGHHD